MKKKFWIVAIAGGGSGGQNYRSDRNAGGGGAGEYFEDTAYDISSNVLHTITVGLGGTSVVGGSTLPDGVNGNNGQDTVFGSLFTLKGGGGGGNVNTSILTPAGGSGGGGASAVNAPKAGGLSTKTIGLGNVGGVAGHGSTDNYCMSGGGGGAGSPGDSGVYNSKSGDGGEGITSSITGTLVARAGGGGGGARVFGVGKAGGSDGSNDSSANGATPNTGSGGGGARGNNRSILSGAGASGVVILRFKTTDIGLIDTTGATISTVGDDTVLEYKGTTGVFEFKVIAEITTQPLSNLTYNSVVANANFSKNESIVSERGFCYSETPNPTTSDNKKISSGDDGAFSETIGGLSSLTTYYIKSYAILDTGTIYGEEKFFKTLDTLSPKIISITPPAIPTNNSVFITIKGLNFQSGAIVEIDNEPCTEIVVVDSETITCVAPASSVQKDALLVVENPDTKKASSPFYYMEQIPPIPPEPSITASFSVKGVGIAK